MLCGGWRGNDGKFNEFSHAGRSSLARFRNGLSAACMTLFSMKPSPAFQFYPHDFLVGTADLSPEEVGAYIRLLCYQWAKSGLPDDDSKLAQLAGCHGNAIASIRHKFGICEDKMLRNPRLEKVRLEQEEYRKKQAHNAKEGWKHRVGNATASGLAMPTNMPNACSSPSSSPSSKKNNTVPNGTGVALRAPVTMKLSDQEFVLSLKTNPAYSFIDIDKEMGKVDAWLIANPGRKKTRKFFVNWLNRIEAPMSLGKQAPKVSHEDQNKLNALRRQKEIEDIEARRVQV